MGFRHPGWRRPIGCLIFIGLVPQKNLTISVSFAENDLQIKASCDRFYLNCFRVAKTHWMPYLDKVIFRRALGLVSLLRKENSNFILVGIRGVADLVGVGGVALMLGV